MPKSATELFVCSNCDSQSLKWQGRCPECGKWGTLEKTTAASLPAATHTLPSGKVVKFDEIETADIQRTSTSINEFDRVLGGGIVPGSLILLGGEPGIGKSTIVLQITQHLDSVLYISGEESGSQIKSRIDRLSIKTQSLNFLGQTNIDTIAATIEKYKPALAIIDSIQTIYDPNVPSGAGSINQVRICTTKLLEVAKKNNITVLIIGHVTKFGEVAGPKTLEHLVDAVLYLEGERYSSYRILRGIKNRFGSTSEVGIFEMTGKGLIEVKDPGTIFLSGKKPTAGTLVTATLEGSRIFFLEVQCLTNTTAFGYPQRKATGIDVNRMQLLIATLTKRTSLKLDNQDIYLNIVGGLKITEPAIDLAICLAIYSATKNVTISSDTIAFGEVGLTGEIRPVSEMEKRIREAKKLGFKNIITANTKNHSDGVSTLAEAIKKIV